MLHLFAGYGKRQHKRTFKKGFHCKGMIAVKLIIQDQEDKKKGKQGIEPPPEQKIGSQKEFEGVHNRDNHRLGYGIQTRRDTAQHPNRHGYLCNADGLFSNSAWALPVIRATIASCRGTRFSTLQNRPLAIQTAAIR